MDNTARIKKSYLVALNVMCILSMVIIVFPLLLISQYNRPSADDGSNGYYGYRVIKDGGSIFAVLGAVLKRMSETYFSWDGRFASVFLFFLQPGTR